MGTKDRQRYGWKHMGAHTRVYFVLSMALIGFGALGLIASLIFTDAPWIEGFYTASLYGNTAGVLLLLLVTVRIAKDAERFRSEARLESKGPEIDE